MLKNEKYWLISLDYPDFHAGFIDAETAVEAMGKLFSWIPKIYGASIMAISVSVCLERCPKLLAYLNRLLDLNEYQNVNLLLQYYNI